MGRASPLPEMQVLPGDTEPPTEGQGAASHSRPASAADSSLLKGLLVDLERFILTVGFSGVANSEEPVWQCRRHKRWGFDPWVGKVPWRRKWQPTPVLFPGESQGQRRLVAYSPWACEESDTTVCTHIHTHVLTAKSGRTYTTMSKTWLWRGTLSFCCCFLFGFSLPALSFFLPLLLFFTSKDYSCKTFKEKKLLLNDTLPIRCLAKWGAGPSSQINKC